MANVNAGQTLSITADTQEITLPWPGEGGYSFQNAGSNTIYFKRVETATFTGTAAELLVLGGAPLAAGMTVFHRDAEEWEAVCATGLASTLQVYPGQIDAAEGDSASEGGGLTFSKVIIAEAAAGIADLGVVTGATDVIRLHELVLTVISQATVTVNYDDDGAATNAVDLTGDIPLGAGGGILRQFNPDPRGTLVTIPHATPKHMTITFATAGGAGWAVISKGPA